MQVTRPLLWLDPNRPSAPGNLLHLGRSQGPVAGPVKLLQRGEHNAPVQERHLSVRQHLKMAAHY